MTTQKNTYHGILKHSVSTESFDISITHHKENSYIPLHAHDRPYLCFSIAGWYEEKNHKKSLIEPGSVLYRNAGYAHSNEFKNIGGLCLNVEIKDAESLILKNEYKLPSSEFHRKVTTDISRLLVSLNQSCHNDIINIQCYESVFSHFQEQNVKGKQKWINDVIGYINDHPFQNISLEKLSNEFQLHPNYVIRKFKEITGYKLSEYLTKIRIEYSIQDLISTENSIGSIAFDNGFYDQSHFNKSFKKHIGTSPLKFKKILKG